MMSTGSIHNASSSSSNSSSTTATTSNNSGSSSNSNGNAGGIGGMNGHDHYNVPSEVDVLETAQIVLRRNQHPLSLLPKLGDSEGWAELKAAYNLTLPQVMALKRFAEQPQSQQQTNAGTTHVSAVTEEYFSLSPAAALKGCLQFIPDVTVLQSLVGPGDCLLNVLTSAGVYASTQDIEFIVDTHRQALDLMAVKPDIDINHLLIIRLYTVEMPIPFYKYVNRVLNEPARSGLQNVAPFMRLLIKALYAMDDAGYGITTQAYRGVRLGNNPALQAKFDNCETVFAPQTLITFAGFTSITVDPLQAEEFGDYFFFHFLNVHGVDISSVSEVPREKELLVIPPSVFRVGGACKLHGKLTVPLTHVDQEEAWYLRRTSSVSYSKEVRCQVIHTIFGVDMIVALGDGCTILSGSDG
jgi:hypothetical protein